EVAYPGQQGLRHRPPERVGPGLPLLTVSPPAGRAAPPRFAPPGETPQIRTCPGGDRTPISLWSSSVTGAGRRFEDLEVRLAFEHHARPRTVIARYPAMPAQRPGGRTGVPHSLTRFGESHVRPAPDRSRPEEPQHSRSTVGGAGGPLHAGGPVRGRRGRCHA